MTSNSRQPVQRFTPSPPPRVTTGSTDVSCDDLPMITAGATPARPAPGVTRPAPRLGGMTGVGAPPELRRRAGAVRKAPGAAKVEEHIRVALCKARAKLLASQRKLKTNVEALRVQLLSRQ